MSIVLSTIRVSLLIMNVMYSSRFHNATENFNKTPRAKRLEKAGAPYNKREIELVKFASKEVVVDNVTVCSFLSSLRSVKLMCFFSFF